MSQKEATVDQLHQMNIKRCPKGEEQYGQGDFYNLLKTRVRRLDLAFYIRLMQTRRYETDRKQANYRFKGWDEPDWGVRTAGALPG